MKLLATLITFITFAASAHAAPETYVIDNHQTVANFSFSYLGVVNKTYKFDKTSGEVVFDRANKSGSADVTIDATSINTGIALFNGQMQSADLFDTAKYPVIRFKSNNMTIDGDQISLAGELTIKGVTKQVTLSVSRFKCAPHPVELVDTCVANATVTIKRSDFSMGKYAFLASDAVTLSLAIGAIKEQPVVHVASRDSGNY